MTKYYHNFVKKSIFWLTISAFFVFSAPVLAKIPTDPEFSKQESMWNQINAPVAWNYSVGSPHVVVAIIDIGLDIDHEDLSNNIWRNIDEIPNNGKDDDRNGYIDDVNGWNFVEDNNEVKIKILPENDEEIISHGTETAGLIGAESNDVGGVGLNWNVRIMPLRAVDNDGNGYMGVLDEAVDYAVRNGADVINLSLVSDSYSDDLKASMKRAYDKGVVIVVAAGNEQRNGEGFLNNFPLYPVCLDNDENENWLVGVTAVNKTDVLSNFANYGSCVDLSAPGQNIYSTSYYQPSQGYENKFEGPFAGTSFSAPLISGATALIRSIRPEWTAKEIIENLETNADNLDLLNPSFVGQMGYGRLNIGQSAINASLNSKPMRGLNKLYYYQKNNIYEYDTQTLSSRLVSPIYGAEIKNMVVADTNDDKVPEIILLLRRGVYEYVHTMKSDGSFVGEFSLPISDTVQQLGVSLENVEEPTIIVERPKKNSNNSLFIKYNLKGEKIYEIEVKKPIKWQATKNGEMVFVYNEKNNLEIKKYDWQGAILNTWNIKGVEKIYDMKTGRVWQNGGEQLIFTVKAGKRNLQYSFDLSSGTTYKDDLATIGKQEWKILVGSYGHSVLPYNESGGIFSVTDGLWGKIGSLKLPALKQGEWVVETSW